MIKTHYQSVSLASLTRQMLDSTAINITNAHGSHQKTLMKRAVFKTSDAELSNDLVQTTFLKTLVYLRKGGKIDNMRAFLNRVLNDLIVDEYRKNKMVSLETLLENGFEPSIDDSERLMNIFDGKKAVLLIGQLPRKYQAVIKMRYIKGLSLKEMALLTGQTQNTVSVQSYRGLKMLKELDTLSRK